MNRREALKSVCQGGGAGLLAAAVITTIPACTPEPAPAAEAISPGLAAAMQHTRQCVAWCLSATPRLSAHQEAHLANRDDKKLEEACDKVEAWFNEGAWREAEAFDAVIAYPVETIADMRAKAAFLSEMAFYCPEQSDGFKALVASMSGMSALSGRRA